MAQNSTYKLTYFDVALFGEGIKYIFGYADVPFEDVRISYSEWWSSLKQKTPFGKVPILEVDGKVLSQTVAIGRFLGKKFGLTTDDMVKEALLEAVVADLMELVTVKKGYYRGYNPKKDADEFALKLLPRFNDLLKDGYFYGLKPTWADVFVVGMFDAMESFEADCFENYSNVKILCDNIKAKPSLKKYLETRPPYTG